MRLKAQLTVCSGVWEDEAGAGWSGSLLQDTAQGVCFRNPEHLGTHALDTGTQLRSLPKEFLPSKELGLLLKSLSTYFREEAAVCAQHWFHSRAFASPSLPWGTGALCNLGTGPVIF